MGIRVSYQWLALTLPLLVYSVPGVHGDERTTGTGSIVKLSPSTSPASAEPGVTLVNLTGSGFPLGTITPGLITVKLAPSSGSGPSESATATAVTTVIGTTRRVTFQVAPGSPLPAPAAYVVSLSGTTTGGVSFSSSNTALLTINPPATIGNLNPASGTPGQTLTVGITGSLRASFRGTTGNVWPRYFGWRRHGGDTGACDGYQSDER